MARVVYQLVGFRILISFFFHWQDLNLHNYQLVLQVHSAQIVMGVKFILFCLNSKLFLVVLHRFESALCQWKKQNQGRMHSRIQGPRNIQPTNVSNALFRMGTFRIY